MPLRTHVEEAQPKTPAALSSPRSRTAHVSPYPPLPLSRPAVPGVRREGSLPERGNGCRAHRQRAAVAGDHGVDRPSPVPGTRSGRLAAVGAPDPSRRCPARRGALHRHGPRRHGRLPPWSDPRQLPGRTAAVHRARGGRVHELPGRRDRLGRHPSPPPRLHRPAGRSSLSVSLRHFCIRPVARTDGCPRRLVVPQRPHVRHALRSRSAGRP